MNKKIFKTTLKVAETLLYALFIVTILVALSPRLPTKNIIQTYVVPTGSMVPLIYPGAVAVVKPNTDVRVGDIIAFENPNDQYQLILHRAIEETNTGWRTKGDANPTIDNWIVPSKNIKGRLLFSIPLVGHIVAFTRTKIGFGLLVLIPGIVLLFLNFREMYEGFKEEKIKRKYKNIVVTIVGGTLLVVVLSSQQVKVVLAQFSTSATISNISIRGATATPVSTPTATASPSPTGSPSSTPTSTPTSSPSPTPTGSPKPHSKCDDFDIEISNNGDHSENEVEIECEESHVIIQVNHDTHVNHINVESDYDTNEGHQSIKEDFNFEKDDLKPKVNFDLCKTEQCKPDSFKNKKMKISMENE
jgi:signal peptidase